MLATRTAPGLEVFRPAAVRVHEVPATARPECLPYAPALSFPQHITAQKAVNAIRDMPADTMSVYYLFVTDYAEHLVGVVSLQQLIAAPPGAQLFEIMDRRIITLPYDATLEEQAHMMGTTGLMALPVIDEDGHLVGALDTTNLVQAVNAEATRQMYLLAGLQQDDSLEHPLLSVVASRAFWLLATMGTLFVAVLLVGAYQQTIAHIALVAALIPLVLGLSNAASQQTLTGMVRSLALGTIGTADTRRVLAREAAISAINGLLCGTLAGLLVWFWQGSAALALVVGVTLMLTLVVGVISGALVPLLFKHVRHNPARGASLLVATTTSLCGLALLLGLANLALLTGA